VRRKVRGTAERPRMSVFVSNRHMSVQFVNDTESQTLAAMSTEAKAFPLTGKKNREAAKELGRLAAEAAKSKGIETVVFDRGGFTYGGRVQEIADAAREAGLQL
jgi:large subunit ribosomal protein L18